MEPLGQGAVEHDILSPPSPRATTSHDHLTPPPHTVGDSGAVLAATVISGASELLGRSSVVLFDEAIRKHIFKKEPSRRARVAQIEIWTRDVAGTAMLELSLIPCVGFMGALSSPQVYGEELSRRNAGSHVATAVFSQILIETLVDASCAFLERRQGIKIERW